MKNIKNIKFVGIITTIIISILLGMAISKMFDSSDADLEKANRNIKALNSELEISKNDYGEIYGMYMALTDNLEELEDLLTMDERQIRELEKTVNDKSKYIAHLENNVRIDTLIMSKEKIIYKHDTIVAPFTFNDKWTDLVGYTSIKGPDCQTTIQQLNIDVPLTVLITQKDKFIIQSECPYFKATEIKATQMRESKWKRFKRKLSMDVNIGFGVQYGLSTKEFDFGPQLGIGFAYQLF